MAPEDVVDLNVNSSDMPMKEDGPVMLDSSAIYGCTGGDWPVNCLHASDSALENSNLNRDATLLALSGPPGSRLQSRDLKEPVVEELTMDQLLGKGIDPRRGEAFQSSQRQWSLLYQLANGSKSKVVYTDSLSRAKDQLMMSAIEKRRSSPDMSDARPLKNKHVEGSQEVGHFSDCQNIVAGSSLLPQDARLRILSTSSFSRFFGSKAVSSKVVGSDHPEGKSCPGVDQKTRNLPLASGVLTDALSDSDVKFKQLRGGSGINPVAFTSVHDGISLREQLKPGCCTINKAEKLDLFRQIVELVDYAHSEGVALQDLMPSYFILMPSNKIKYIGSSIHEKMDRLVPQDVGKKRPAGEDSYKYGVSPSKKAKLKIDHDLQTRHSSFTSRCYSKIERFDEMDYNRACSSSLGGTVHQVLDEISDQSIRILQKYFAIDPQLEIKWYNCPEELSGRCTTSSNIYSLGILLFELLCHFESLEEHAASMLQIHQRILPPSFLSGNPKEAAFCLWLLCPEPSSRPTTREILCSDLIWGSQELHCSSSLQASAQVENTESELLLSFLNSLKENKQDQASKLVQDIKCIEADLREMENRYLLGTASVSCSQSPSAVNEARLTRNLSQLENAYFSMRSQTNRTEKAASSRKELQRNRERWSKVHHQSEGLNLNKKSGDWCEIFFEGLCKYTCYSKLEVRGTIRNSDLLNSANVICTLSFDRDEEYIAAGGVSRKIKIFELCNLLDEEADIHYPTIEMVNNSKLTCISWNNYIKNYLGSTDYDGAVKIWDASSGHVLSQYMEHQKRAWSIDFSQVDPSRFASGSDDCSVKLWNSNEKRSTCTIRNPANVCCVQFSPYSSHFLAFGSADSKIYGYDLRHTRIPWCTLGGHGKTVSYVKFLDSENLVSASTDNTLKLWNLNATSWSGPSSDACGLSFKGHTNEKNFVGLSVRNGYIACGSESNEVYTYYKALPMPITSHKFGSVDPISGIETNEDDGQFISSVCWAKRSNIVAAANSTGNIKFLQLV